MSLVVLVLSGCSSKATAEECQQAAEHYVDLSLAGDPALQGLPPAQANAARDMKRAIKLGEASFRKVVERCTTEVTRKESRCARSANTIDEWQSCID